ncbi:hypothetical protein RCL1_004595 [Eukaryota sp. TZLM3-RCL]
MDPSLHPLADYEELYCIGNGTYGKVSKMRRRSDNRIFAVKEVDYGRMSEKEKELLVSEVNILRNLHHPHIVQYYDRIIDRRNTKIYIVMEYCEGGDLAGLIKRCNKERTHITEPVIWKILSQLVSALHTCHTNKSGSIVHRDIKPGNIFLDVDKFVKIGDFGLARILGEYSVAQTSVGTPLYMSPEQVQGRPYTFTCDIWALGCVIYELCALVPPFTATTVPGLHRVIMNGHYAPVSSKYSSTLRHLIAQMLTLDPNSRATIQVLYDNPEIRLLRREVHLSRAYIKHSQKDEELVNREKALEQAKERAEDALRHIESLVNNYMLDSSTREMLLATSRSLRRVFE